MKLEERKRRMKAKFDEVDENFVDEFGNRSRVLLEEASARAGIDLRGWKLRSRRGMQNAWADPKNKEVVVGDLIGELKTSVFKFVLLHELGHVKQFVDKRLELTGSGWFTRWEGKTILTIASGPAEYAALPWERDASDFAMSSPLYDKVEERDMEGLQGNLFDTLREHLKMKRIR